MEGVATNRGQGRRRTQTDLLFLALELLKIVLRVVIAIPVIPRALEA